MGHKPPMNKDTRKVLDLLEFCLEMNPDVGSVYNAFVLCVAQQEEDLCWVNDDEWAAWFQDYADKLLKEAKEKNNEVSS